MMHDIIGDIVDWDEAHKTYLAAEGATGTRYNQRLESAKQMAQIEARWQHLPGGFHGERKLIKAHIRAVADAAPSMSIEQLCWLAIAAASAWLPNPAPVTSPSHTAAPAMSGPRHSSQAERPGGGVSLTVLVISPRFTRERHSSRTRLCRTNSTFCSTDSGSGPVITSDAESSPESM
jgi:hypothetical protein